MTEDEIHERARIGLLEDSCSDDEFSLIEKWYKENDPVAVRIIGHYKMSGYRIPLDPTGGWSEVERADKLGDLMARTFIGLSYCRGLQAKFFRITQTMRHTFTASRK